MGLYIGFYKGKNKRKAGILRHRKSAGATFCLQMVEVLGYLAKVKSSDAPTLNVGVSQLILYLLQFESS